MLQGSDVVVTFCAQTSKMRAEIEMNVKCNSYNSWRFGR